jgi:hypothetical protein
MRTTKRSKTGVLAVLASLAFLTACASGSAATGTAATGTPSPAATAAGGGSSSFGLQGGAGSIPGSPGRQMSGYSGSFSVAFARCMRAHGVPAFPDPDGAPDQLMASGIDTTSARFQAALHGPCKALAPAGWAATEPLQGPPARS